ncbi:MAG: LysM domain-containing protein, partial [Bacteroidota bacterium]
MRKTFLQVFILCVLSSVALFYSKALSSEDTAQLTFRKTAIPKKNFQTYTVSESVGSKAYQVKKGDSLIRIVHRELHITTRTQKTMLLIKSLNPDIKDAHKIIAGQIIRLPKGQTAIKTVEVNIAQNK